MQLTPRPTPPLLATHRGFTLAETLVAVVVALLGLATALSFNRFQLYALRNQVNQIDTQMSVRNFLDLFAREVRRAGQDPTCVKTFSALAEAGSWRLRLQSDFNADGATTGPDEDVTYAYNWLHNRIERTANGATDTLVRDLNVYESTLRYFDASGNELAPAGWFDMLSASQRALVRRVRIQLRFAGRGVDPLNQQPLFASASTDVDLRNRFFITGTACP